MCHEMCVSFCCCLSEEPEKGTLENHTPSWLLGIDQLLGGKVLMYIQVALCVCSLHFELWLGLCTFVGAAILEFVYLVAL